MPQQIWIVDDDQSIRWVLDKALSGAGFNTVLFDCAEAALERVLSERPDAVLADIRMPGQSGLELLHALGHADEDPPVILMTAYADLDSAVSAYREGAFEYLPKPFDVDEVISLVRRALNRDEQTVQPRPAVMGSPIIGEAPPMQAVFRVVGRLARSNVSVLIRGESGTGKELIARAIYDSSPRAGGPFIALNSASIPVELLESELFGHERGAFTGADVRRHGRFEQADGGTLFLDEIGDMPVDLQTRLLRVLSDGSFYRVGGHHPLRVDVRIIAATHQDLETRVAEGTFREDLYHRLDVIAIELPPLRERAQDIPLLTQQFLELAAHQLGVEPKSLSTPALKRLMKRQWPGNVRELENLCQRLTVMAPGRVIDVQDLPPEQHSVRQSEKLDAGERWEESLAQLVRHKIATGHDTLLEELLPRFEGTLLRTALTMTDGRKQRAARLLGWGRNTLTRKLKELKFDAPGKKDSSQRGN
jgi:two-component system nitrogen regulation response regulator GlnG